MPRVLISCLLVLMLVACETSPDVNVVDPEPCPPSAAADLEPPVERVQLTPEQRLAADRALSSALTPPIFVAWSLGEALHEARAKRIEARAEATREWCAARE